MFNRLRKLITVLSKLRPSNAGQFADKLGRNLTKRFKPFLFRLTRKKFNSKDVILIFSENRGGSTWLMETMQREMNAVTSFEPLFSWEGKFKKFGHKFSSPFYFSDEESEIILKKFLSRTFKGKETSARCLQFNSTRQLFSGSKLLVKMVNVNLIAPWVVKQFEFTYKPVYLIRHPLAILASQIKYSSQGNNEDISNKSISYFDLNRIKSKHHPYLEYIDLLNSAETKHQRYLMEWCIRNRDILNGYYENDLITVYYEDLVLNEGEAFERIFNEWNMEYQDINPLVYTKSSGTTTLGEKVLDGEQQLKKWFKLFNEDEKKEFQKILDHFEIDTYNSYEATPLHLQNRIF